MLFAARELSATSVCLCFCVSVCLLLGSDRSRSNLSAHVDVRVRLLPLHVLREGDSEWGPETQRVAKLRTGADLDMVTTAAEGPYFGRESRMQ
jgi:hypothetical protein